jgi:hypothetical protein
VSDPLAGRTVAAVHVYTELRIVSVRLEQSEIGSRQFRSRPFLGEAAALVGLGVVALPLVCTGPGRAFLRRLPTSALSWLGHLRPNVNVRVLRGARAAALPPPTTRVE